MRFPGVRWFHSIVSVTNLRPRLPRTTLVLIAAASLLHTSACHQMTETKPDHPNIATGISLQDITFRSAALDRYMPYRVFRPSNPGAKSPLPVVYLLHGAGDDFRTWSNNTGVSKYAASGLMLVMPEGNLSYYLNAAGAHNERYEDYMLHDLIADVESRFPVRRDRAGRGIIGISMGGYAAIYYALSRADLFAFAAAISPALDVPSRGFT